MFLYGIIDVLTIKQRIVKRIFDFLLALLGLLACWWLIIIAWILSSINTRSNGFFTQTRIGLYGKPFKVIKIKTMRPIKTINTTVTKKDDPRITKLGAFFRNYKIDELPQLWNVLIGDMSFVGPRPDVPGFADKLQGQDRNLLSIRPGITGPASLKYRDEEILLSNQSNPEHYNRNVIWPDKVRVNLDYMANWSLAKDLKYIFNTVFH